MSQPDFVKIEAKEEFYDILIFSMKNGANKIKKEKDGLWFLAKVVQCTRMKKKKKTINWQLKRTTKNEKRKIIIECVLCVNERINVMACLFYLKFSTRGISPVAMALSFRFMVVNCLASSHYFRRKQTIDLSFSFW